MTMMMRTMIMIITTTTMLMMFTLWSRWLQLSSCQHAFVPFRYKFIVISDVDIPEFYLQNDGKTQQPAQITNVFNKANICGTRVTSEPTRRRRAHTVVNTTLAAEPKFQLLQTQRTPFSTVWATSILIAYPLHHPQCYPHFLLEFFKYTSSYKLFYQNYVVILCLPHSIRMFNPSQFCRTNHPNSTQLAAQNTKQVTTLYSLALPLHSSRVQILSSEICFLKTYVYIVSSK